MQEQLDDFREREDSMRAMYEKILSALNTQIQECSAASNQNMMQSIDIGRVQELLLELKQSQQNSPTHSEKSLNSSFQRRNQRSTTTRLHSESVMQEQAKEKEKMQQEINSLERDLRQAAEQNLKLKSQLTNKEKENITIKIEVDKLRDQISDLNNKLVQ